VTLDTTSGVPAPVAANGMVLGRPVPNPFNPSTQLALSLPRDGNVRLAIHDVRGALVRVLADGPLAAGDHRYTWDGRDDRGLQVPSGLYLARAAMADGSVQVQRLTLAK
jgi:flagellar hook assembly protein FlgD